VSKNSSFCRQAVTVVGKLEATARGTGRRDDIPSKVGLVSGAKAEIDVEGE